ncbi:integrator complex subunit 3 [Pluvialis apricaria]
MEMQKGKGGTAGGGKLLVSTLLDAKDELEERLERCVGIVTSLTNGLSEREANDALNAHICKGTPQHEEICLGLFTLVLTEPAQAQKCYRDLALVSRDGMNIVLNKINHILMEKYLKLQDTCRTQLVWLLRELVKSGVLGADGVCMTFMKQIAGGDVTAKNIWLAENVLEILTEQREWVLKSSLLIAMAVYTYLRLIVDHHGTSQLQVLRQKEVDFCVSLLRERFMDCFMIGRDLVRLLQNVARIPEFEQLWKDIIHNPQVLSTQFTGVLQLLQSRTSRKFLACRLTPDMETKLLFMTSRVRFGQQKRYQDWFQRQYLSTPDSQSLRCDLIRYICGVVHPSNEVLSSDILPRWAIIGWLLTTCTSNVAASNAKLALFYDWLFFNPEKDSIMNIEPAILVMHHSMKPHPAITATLLDFMCRIIPNFYPPLEAHVRQGVFNSLTHIVEKRVLAHLAPLFDNPKLDKELRAMLREKFPEFCSSPSPPIEVKIEEPVSMEMDNHMSEKDDSCYDNAEAAFSDDEDDLNSKGKKREFRCATYASPSSQESERGDRGQGHDIQKSRHRCRRLPPAPRLELSNRPRSGQHQPHQAWISRDGTRSDTLSTAGQEQSLLSSSALDSLHKGSLIRHEGSLIRLLSEPAGAKTFCGVCSKTPPGNPTPAFPRSCLYWPLSQARRTRQQISSDISEKENLPPATWFQ